MTKRLLLFVLLVAIAPAVFAQTFTATLAGANEVPTPGDPNGSGFAVVTFSGTTMTYSILTTGLSPITGAHIHTGAAGEAPANNILIAFTAAPVGGQIIGTQTDVPQTAINQIVSNPGGFYVNVHSSEFPAGAIRGQLVRSGSAAGGRTQFLPLVGKVAGAAGTNFVTDIRIVNESGTTANVTIDYFQTSTTGLTAPTASRTFTVAPGEQEVIDDLIGALGASNLGGLRITSDQNVSAVARIINDLRGSNQGTTGLATKAVELSAATTSGTLPFLSTSSVADIGTGVGFRTNLGYFNPTANPATLTLTARRSTDGAVLGTQVVTAPGFSQVQQGAFALIGTVPAGDQVQPNFYVTWEASAPIFVFGAVVDNKTGDSVLVQ